MGKSLGRERTFEEVAVLSLERNIGREEYRVSGIRRELLLYQSRGPMTEKAQPCQVMIGSYGMERTDVMSP